MSILFDAIYYRVVSCFHMKCSVDSMMERLPYDFESTDKLIAEVRELKDAYPESVELFCLESLIVEKAIDVMNDRYDTMENIDFYENNNKFSCKDYVIGIQDEIDMWNQTWKCYLSEIELMCLDARNAGIKARIQRLDAETQQADVNVPEYIHYDLAFDAMLANIEADYIIIDIDDANDDIDVPPVVFHFDEGVYKDSSMCFSM